MIHHETRCVFIHQRKCAGTSIKEAFGVEKPDPDRPMFEDGPLSTNPPWSRKEAEYADYFTFAVIRNPFDRFVSGWKYLQSTRDRTLHDVLTHPPAAGHDYDHLTRRQVDILCHPDGTFAFDYLIRFEHLQADFDRVCDRLGKPRTALRARKKGKRRNYRWYLWQARNRHAIRDRYALDFLVWENASRINAHQAGDDGRSRGSRMSLADLGVRDFCAERPCRP